MPEEEPEKASYQDPETGSVRVISHKNGTISVEENNRFHFEIVSVGEDTFKGHNIVITFERENSAIVRIRVEYPDKECVFLPFLENAPELEEYKGEYYSDELKMTYRVYTDNKKLCMQNENKHRCALDLCYECTIKDYFIAYDPCVDFLIIKFLRDGSAIRAFVFMDVDGDNRDKVEFAEV